MLYLSYITLTRIWNSAVCHKFSEKNTKAPHVTLDTKSAVIGCLGSGPFDRESKILNLEHDFLISTFEFGAGKQKVYNFLQF